MMQLKAIFSDLLRRYEFELAQPPETYRNDHSKMVVQLAQPCRARYRRREAPAFAAGVTAGGAATLAGASEEFRVAVDADLCQGHAVCVSEAPEVFALEDGKVKLLQSTLDAGLRESVRLAVRHCPTRALSIEE
jgi:sterol 14-demethylase